jgi:hypothetical protein
MIGAGGAQRVKTAEHESVPKLARRVCYSIRSDVESVCWKMDGKYMLQPSLDLDTMAKKSSGKIRVTEYTC